MSPVPISTYSCYFRYGVGTVDSLQIKLSLIFLLLDGAKTIKAIGFPTALQSTDTAPYLQRNPRKQVLPLATRACTVLKKQTFLQYRGIWQYG